MKNDQGPKPIKKDKDDELFLKRHLVEKAPIGLYNGGIPTNYLLGPPCPPPLAQPDLVVPMPYTYTTRRCQGRAREQGGARS